MKNYRLTLFTGILVAVILVASCGDGGKAEKEKATQDSIRVADSIAMVEEQAQREADSIAALPKSIAETAMGVETLTTLVAALQQAELVETFKGDGDFTVFAPTNDAFAAAQSTVDMLMKPENKSKLQNVLKYHVVDGAALSTDLTDGQELTTLQGEKLKVSIADGKVSINGAQVVMADVEASNGVVHVINQVVVPKKL